MNAIYLACTELMEIMPHASIAIISALQTKLKSYTRHKNIIALIRLTFSPPIDNSVLSLARFTFPFYTAKIETSKYPVAKVLAIEKKI